MIQKLIDELLLEEREAEISGRVSSGKFSVSDAGRCRLMRYWKRKGEPALIVPDERALRLFETGKIFENWVIEVLRKKSKLLSTQMIVEDRDRKGLLDALAQGDIKQILYDIKTVNSRKFWRNSKEGWEKADPHYQAQVVSYWDMLPPGDKEKTECRVAYLSKDDLCIQEVGVSIPRVLPLVQEDWNILIACWDKSIQPDANPMSWECTYCMFSPECEFKPSNASKGTKGKVKKNG